MNNLESSVDEAKVCESEAPCVNDGGSLCPKDWSPRFVIVYGVSVPFKAKCMS